MIAVELSKPLEKRLRDVIQENYHGNMQVAIKVFLQLHEKYGWKEQLLADVKSIRSEVRRRGGIKQKAIDEAIKRYRKSLGASRA
jgi:hypothetical protein